MDKNNIVVAVLVIALIIIGLVIFRRQDVTNLLSTNLTPSPTSTTIPEMSPTPGPLTSMTVELTPVDSSLYNQTGTVLITQKNNQVVVTITVNQPNGVGGSQPVHIHSGTCPGVGKIIYPLSNIVNGKSVTTLNTTLSKLKAQEPLVINIHKSASEIGVYTACGSLSK